MFHCPFCTQYVYSKEARERRTAKFIRERDDSWYFICSRGFSLECRGGVRSMHNFLLILNPDLYQEYQFSLAWTDRKNRNELTNYKMNRWKTAQLKSPGTNIIMNTFFTSIIFRHISWSPTSKDWLVTHNRVNPEELLQHSLKTEDQSILDEHQWCFVVLHWITMIYTPWGVKHWPLRVKNIDHFIVKNQIQFPTNDF